MTHKKSKVLSKYRIDNKTWPPSSAVHVGACIPILTTLVALQFAFTSPLSENQVKKLTTQTDLPDFELAGLHMSQHDQAQQ